MAQIKSTQDGSWTDTSSWVGGAVPINTTSAVVNHRIFVPAMQSAVVCSSLRMSTTGGVYGGLIAQGPKSFITVGPSKILLQTATEIQALTASRSIPVGGSR